MLGRCALDESSCEVTQAGCQAQAECAKFGWYSALDGVCIATTSADCTLVERGGELGCAAVNHECRPTE